MTAASGRGRQIAWINSGDRTGGAFAYGATVRRLLQPHYDIELRDLRQGLEDKGICRPFALFGRFCRLRFDSPPDVIVRDALELVVLPLERFAHNVVVIHHVDNSYLGRLKRWLLCAIDPICLWHLRNASVIVTVADCWARWFKGLGFSNVQTIYNAVDESEFEIGHAEVQEFRRRHQLDDRPICQMWLRSGPNARFGRG